MKNFLRSPRNISKVSFQISWYSEAFQEPTEKPPLQPQAIICRNHTIIICQLHRIIMQPLGIINKIKLATNPICDTDNTP